MYVTDVSRNLRCTFAIKIPKRAELIMILLKLA